MAAGTGDEEEEKTTLESGWEDEPSTTVEQGDAADRIRAPAAEGGARRTATHVTSTNGGIADELTVDDQRANAAISIITPASLQARLVVTGGNDSGQEVAVQPGKTYTIGRAVENDIVLTDIAVSRKHFDLRHEAGSWVLVDRGSGNGTVVNGNIEDHPFLLANGDAIEIGNTTFRFELPNGAPRPQSSFDGSMDAPNAAEEEDEEEPSTVAGKPVRGDDLATNAQIPARGQPMAPRAKTMPPPAPLRPRSPSAQAQGLPNHPRPHLGPMPGSSAAMTNPVGGPLPASTLPMPQHHHARPLGTQAPAMLGDAMGIPMHGQMQHGLPSTIPGQGSPMGSQPQPQMYNPYPNTGQPPPPNLQHMLVINGMPAGRTDPSTALVPPTPYGGIPVMVPAQGYFAPTIPRKTKLILGGAGLTLFAALATVAIIKGAGGGGSAPKPSAGSATAKPSAKESPAKDVPKTEPKSSVVPPKTEPKVTVQPIIPPVKTGPSKTEPAKTESKLATAIKSDLPAVVQPKVEPKATIVPPTVAQPTVVPPKTDPKIAVVAPVVEPKKEPKKKDPPKIAKKAPPLPKKDPLEETPIKKEPKRVAVGGDPESARPKADALYKAKKFGEAAKVMMAGSKAASDPDLEKDLRLKAGFYLSFGKNFNIGMAPATSAKDAWAALTSAKTYDRSLGGHYTSEIDERMGEIAPKAAVAFMAGKDYTKAKQAVGLAESSGNSNSTTQGVRSSLEQKAGELYKEAQALQSSDEAGATSKYREIQRMVDSKSQWHQKAGKALSAIKAG